MGTSNKKIVLTTEIIENLVVEKKVDKSLADEFVKVFISTIEERLIARKSVKIKGLGRLKVEKNDNKHKVVYTPNEKLENTTNAPFAHLKPVELNVPNFDKKESKNTQEENNNTEQREPLTVFQNQALEIKELLTEIGSISSKNVASENKEKIEEKREKVVEVEKDFTDDKKLDTSKENIVEGAKKEDSFDTVYEFSTKKKEKKEKKKKKKDKKKKKKNDDKAVETVVKDVKVKQSKKVDKEVDDKKNKSKKETETIQTEDFISNVKFKKYFVDDDIYDEKEEKKNRKRLFWFLLLLLGVVLIALLFFFVRPEISEYLENKRKNERLEFLKDSVHNELKNKEYQKTLDSLSNKDTTNVLTTDKKTAVEKTKTTEEDIFSVPRKHTQSITVINFSVGQNLAYLSRKYYGHSYFWVYIYEANRTKIKNPNDIPIGTRLKIPKLNKKLIDKRNPKCLEYAWKLRKKYLSK